METHAGLVCQTRRGLRWRSCVRSGMERSRFGLAKGTGKEAKVETLEPGAELDLVGLRREAASRAGRK